MRLDPDEPGNGMLHYGDEKEKEPWTTFEKALHEDAKGIFQWKTLAPVVATVALLHLHHHALSAVDSLESPPR